MLSSDPIHSPLWFPFLPAPHGRAGSCPCRETLRTRKHHTGHAPCIHVDALDVGILRGMDARPYGPRPKHPDALKASHLATTLGTTHVTVRERIARMEDAGVIAGYQIYPNLGHLGLAASSFLYHANDESLKASALKTAREHGAWVEIHDFLGTAACIDLAYSDPSALAQARAHLGELFGDAEPRALYDRQMPHVTRPLTNVDWRILRALRGRAKWPLAGVAEELGLSLKTVRRHYDRMAEEGSFFAVPQLDLSRLRGVIPFFLNFHASGPLSNETTRAVASAYKDRRIHTYQPVDAHLGRLGLMLFAWSIAEMDELRGRGLGIPGVEGVSAWIYRGWDERSSWLDAAIDMKLHETRT